MIQAPTLRPDQPAPDPALKAPRQSPDSQNNAQNTGITNAQNSANTGITAANNAQNTADSCKNRLDANLPIYDSIASNLNDLTNDIKSSTTVDNIKNVLLNLCTTLSSVQNLK